VQIARRYQKRARKANDIEQRIRHALAQQAGLSYAKAALQASYAVWRAGEYRSRDAAEIASLLAQWQPPSVLRALLFDTPLEPEPAYYVRQTLGALVQEMILRDISISTAAGAELGQGWPGQKLESERYFQVPHSAAARCPRKSAWERICSSFRVQMEARTAGPRC
jgi:hypothetical protein